MTYGYCSHCGHMLSLERLPEHQVQVHPGDQIYATLYRPDPAQMALNARIADELMAVPSADEDPSLGS